MPWGLQGCQYIVAWGYVEAGALLPYLPDGFRPRTSGGVGPQALLQEPVLFGADAMQCASGRALDGNVSPLDYGYIWAAADPPEAFLQDGVDPGEHYAKWDILVPDAERRAVLAGRGVPVHAGAAAVAEGAGGIDASVSLDGFGTITIRGIATQEIGGFDGSFVKMSASAEGVVAWRAHALSGPRMTGSSTLEFPPGSWVAQVIGDTMLRGGFHAGTWSYDKAELVFMER